MPAPVNKALAGTMLVLLCFENATSSMARRWVVGVRHIQFSKSTVLMANEAVKLIFSLIMTMRASRAYDPASPSHTDGATKRTSVMSVLTRIVARSGKMIVPAVTYLIVNLISYPAIARIDASVFTAISQLKIVATAMCSVLVLGRKISLRKWRTLMLLVCGVMLISVSSAPSGGHGKEIGREYLVGIGYAMTQVAPLTGTTTRRWLY
jgi:drug/metabolite transporter (DMT)-like permease